MPLPADRSRFSANHPTHRWPFFLPDGKHFLFFATNHSGNSEQGVYFGNLADGSFKHVLDTDSDTLYASGYLLYHVQSQLLAVKFDVDSGTASGEPFTLASWLACTCTDSGREEVYVTHFPGGEGRWQISQTGGTFPAWRGDSKEIYFVGLDGAVHAASVNPQKDEFELEQVRPLFRVNYTAPLETLLTTLRMGSTSSLPNYRRVFPPRWYLFPTGSPT